MDFIDSGRPGNVDPTIPFVPSKDQLRPGIIEETLFQPRSKTENTDGGYYDPYQEKIIPIRETTTRDILVTVPNSVLELIPQDDSIDNYWSQIRRTIQIFAKIRAARAFISRKRIVLVETSKKLLGFFSFTRFKALFRKEPKSVLPEPDKPADWKEYYKLLTSIKEQYQELAKVIREYDKYGICLFRPGAHVALFPDASEQVQKHLMFWNLCGIASPLGKHLNYPDEERTMNLGPHLVTQYKVPATYHIDQEISKMHDDLKPWMLQLPEALIEKLEIWAVDPDAEVWKINTKTAILQVPEKIQKTINVLKAELESYQKQLSYQEIPEDSIKLKEIRSEIENNTLTDALTDFERQQFPINCITNLENTEDVDPGRDELRRSLRSASRRKIMAKHMSKLRVFFNRNKS